MKTDKPWTNHEVALLSDLWHQGTKIGRISELLDRSYSAVHAMVRRQGFDLRRSTEGRHYDTGLNIRVSRAVLEFVDGRVALTGTTRTHVIRGILETYVKDALSCQPLPTSTTPSLVRSSSRSLSRLSRAQDAQRMF